MRELLHGETARVEFAVTDTPDSLPTASCYAGTTLLGSATVSSLGGTNNYSATYALPGSGITAYTVISFRVDVVVDAASLPTTTLIAGELVAARRNSTTPPTVGAVADEVQTRTIARVTIVDTCSVNSDMRGTDSALTTLGTNAPAGWLNAAAFASGAFDAVWSVTTRTLSAFGFNVTLTSAYDAAKTAAQPSDVSPTIDFDPAITVNPTELSNDSVNSIRSGLALSTDVTTSTNTITTAIDNITVELSPENIEEISGTVAEAVGEGLIEQIERSDGMLQTILSKFNGISRLAEWLRR
jgi:hypothetical protein